MDIIKHIKITIIFLFFVINKIITAIGILKKAILPKYSLIIIPII